MSSVASLRMAYVEGRGTFRLLGFYRGTAFTGAQHLIAGERTAPGYMVKTADVPKHRLPEAHRWLAEHGPNVEEDRWLKEMELRHLNREEAN